METPLTAAQTVLSSEEAGIGISLVTFFQFFGSAVFLAIAQTVFSNVLTTEITKRVPQVDPKTLMRLGTSAVRSCVTSDELPAVLAAYNKAITSTFYVSASAATCSVLAVFLLEWNSVKDKSSAATDVTDSTLHQAEFETSG
jgi:hypothetical protein